MPEMFGVMMLATVVMIGVNMFSDIGLRQVVIRSNRALQPDFYNTVWTIQVIRGLLIGTFLVLLGLMIGFLSSADVFPTDSAYANPSLSWVLVGLAATAVFQGIESTKAFLAQRDMEVYRTTAIELTSQLASLAVMLAWAWESPTVFALVAGAIVASIVKATATHWFLPGPPNTLRWDSTSAREVFSLGSWVFLTSIFGFLVTSGDRLIFGWILTTEELGLYALATLLVLAAHEIVNKLISHVAFPALSAIHRNNPKDLTAAFYRLRLPIDAVCLIGAGLMFASAETIVDILYSERYTAASSYLATLALTLVSLRFSVASQMFFVIGEARLMFEIQIARLCTLVLGVPIGFNVWGVQGALWAVVLSFWAGMFMNLLIYMPRHRLINYPKEIALLSFGVIGLATGWLINSIYGNWL